MAHTFSRLDRIAEQIQKDLSVIIQRELKDPRLGMVTICGAKISKDLGYADIYFTVLNIRDVDDESAITQALQILKDASGFLRSELSHAIKLRSMPLLRFHYDYSIAHAQHITGLISKVRANDEGSE
mgnify:CR=1 FL=1